MHRDSNRPRRVGELLKRQLVPVIAQELNDPDVGAITLTGVDTAPDLKSAKVYFTCPQDGDDQKRSRVIEAALNRAAGYIRHCLKERVELRGIPRLQFKYDDSIERGSRIEQLLSDAMSDSPRNKD
ncbi:MAG: 30S ribosome-binding factor RbfA [Gammaproteobacteria bacterium]|nr:MAG: 30S ribosome-binding factor RbfA [Gammaproteobacteria bacterium]